MPNSTALLPTLTVGTVAIPVIAFVPNGSSPTNGFAHRRFSLSVSVQSDPANTGTIYVGDSTVSITKYSRALSPGDWYTVQGSAVDPSKLYLVSDVAAQLAHPSRN